LLGSLSELPQFIGPY